MCRMRGILVDGVRFGIDLKLVKIEKARTCI